MAWRHQMFRHTDTFICVMHEPMNILTCARKISADRGGIENLIDATARKHTLNLTSSTKFIHQDSSISYPGTSSAKTGLL
jgi:hypothetical protein